MNNLSSHIRILILLAFAPAVGCGQQRDTTRPEVLRSDDGRLGSGAGNSSFAKDYLEGYRGVDIYKKAVIAAIHHFADCGEIDDLVGLIERHPGLVDDRLVVHIRPPRTDDRYTPLHRAAAHGEPGPVEYLLERKADINGDGGGGWTPLHLAARSGQLEVCRLLLERGANANALTTPLPKRVNSMNGPPVSLPAEPARTPLDVARLEEHQPIVDLLLAHGKKSMGPVSSSNWSLFVEQSAARSGGIDPYRKALIASIHYFVERGELDEFVGIIEKYPDLVDARLIVVGLQPKPDDGYAPLHRAVHEGCSRIVEYLLDRKADVNGDGGQGWTPLRIAKRDGQFEIAQLLREKGAKEGAPTAPVPESK